MCVFRSVGARMASRHHYMSDEMGPAADAAHNRSRPSTAHSVRAALLLLLFSLSPMCLLVSGAAPPRASNCILGPKVSLNALALCCPLPRNNGPSSAIVPLSQYPTTTPLQKTARRWLLPIQPPPPLSRQYLRPHFHCDNQLLVSAHARLHEFLALCTPCKLPRPVPTLLICGLEPFGAPPSVATNT